MKLNLSKSQSGMTLIEILITVAIIGLIMGLAVGIFNDTSSKLSDLATQLSGTIKYVYNEAAVKNQYYRMLIDLNDQSFSVEASSEPFKIGNNEEGTADLEDEKLKPLSEKNEPAPADSAPPTEEASGAPPAPGTFSSVSSYLLKPIKLPDSIRIKDVYVKHSEKRVESGKTAIYFFPNGWVEKAVINLSDEKGESFYSVETFPMTGKTKIRSEYFDYKPEEEKE
ncbi:MAG: prepilin-type N-terminal cleavage/methylation domain-containing protein [Deltaproteobacteria bacterium]|nr:prepilin-type N-terminal cleavage/methylation domain-containing protein [Deltaproteobacteria bacterium]